MPRANTWKAWDAVLVGGGVGVVLCWLLMGWTWQRALLGSLSAPRSPATLGASGTADETSRPKDV